MFPAEDSKENRTLKAHIDGSKDSAGGVSPVPQPLPSLTGLNGYSQLLEHFQAVSVNVLVSSLQRGTV